jgi:hypothetical protein
MLSKGAISSDMCCTVQAVRPPSMKAVAAAPASGGGGVPCPGTIGTAAAASFAASGGARSAV